MMFSLWTACVLGAVYLDDPIDADWAAAWKDSAWHDNSAAFDTQERAGRMYLRTPTDARFYAISRGFDAPASSVEKPLVIQYRTGSPQSIDCGGTYVKLLGSEHKEALDAETPYRIMFGPDVCGNSRRVHLILEHKGKTHERRETLAPPADTKVHTYTAILHPNTTYEIYIDASQKAAGTLRDDWPFLAPKEINDPSVSKPADWVDEKMIDDPEASKPEDWDAPEKIVDPDAVQPDDWDAEEDGEWEAPVIANPAYKGEWKAPRIDNPAYNGEWIHPQVANPEYADDPSIGQYTDVTTLAIEVWQVKSGSLFGGFYIGDDVEEALARAFSFADLVEEDEAVASQDDEEEKEEEEEKDEL